MLSRKVTGGRMLAILLSANAPVMPTNRQAILDRCLTLSVTFCPKPRHKVTIYAMNFITLGLVGAAYTWFNIVTSA